MKRLNIAILAGFLLVGTSAPAFAQGLLGGVISGSGGNGLVTIGSGDSGSNGLVNIGLGGGGSGSVLDVNVGSGGGSGGLLGVDVGGQGSSSNLVDVNVLTGPNGRPGTTGQPGAPGQPGAHGQPGFVGLNGSSGSNGFNGSGGSSKITFLARLLEGRAWLRFATGNAVCLPPAGIADVRSLLSQRDAKKANQLLGSYAGDIGNLRNLLKKCGTRTISQADIERAVAVDLRRDGTVVLYVL